MQCYGVHHRLTTRQTDSFTCINVKKKFTFQKYIHILKINIGVFFSQQSRKVANIYSSETCNFKDTPQNFLDTEHFCLNRAGR